MGNITIDVCELNALEGRVVGIYEDFAEEYNLNITNKERDDDKDVENPARIYATHYDMMILPIETKFVYLDTIPHTEDWETGKVMLRYSKSDKSPSDILQDIGNQISTEVYDVFKKLFAGENPDFDFDAHKDEMISVVANVIRVNLSSWIVDKVIRNTKFGL
jgi:hypothetical protein